MDRGSGVHRDRGAYRTVDHLIKRERTAYFREELYVQEVHIRCASIIQKKEEKGNGKIGA